jgi:hypothetical protein
MLLEAYKDDATVIQLLEETSKKARQVTLQQLTSTIEAINLPKPDPSTLN